MPSAVDRAWSIYKCYAGGDIAGTIKQFSKDIRFVWICSPELSPYSNEIKGQDAFIKRIKELDLLFEYVEYDVLDLFGEGDRAAGRVSVTLRNRRTRREVSSELGHFWRFDNDEASELVEFHDTALIARTIMDAMGEGYAGPRLV